MNAQDGGQRVGLASLANQFVPPIENLNHKESLIHQMNKKT